MSRPRIEYSSGGDVHESQFMKAPNICISLFENDPLRAVGFLSILDRVPGFQVTAMSVSEILAVQGVDVAVIGNRSPLFFETMAQLKTSCPKVRVVVTGRGADDETILKAIVYGAKGYVDEAAPTNELVQAIHTVHKGSIWGPRRVLSMFVERSGDLLRQRQAGCSSITSREKQVLTMLVEGRSNKEIGAPLGIEERTVKAHVAKLMRKVGARNRICLSVEAIKHSLVSAQQ
jgi:DNA-binding NarL/FixJ family response regulator